MESGDVIRCKVTFPNLRVRIKRLIVVDPETRECLCINSEPRKFTPQATIILSPSEASYLDHESHVDTSKLERPFQEDFNQANVIGHISNDIKDKIRDQLEENTILAPRYKKLIQAKFL